MALPTYLELVNDVLIRLREPEVSTVKENTLSKLIGKLVNDAKRQVEDAYNWNALTATLTTITEPNIFSYGLTNIRQRFKVLDAFNATRKYRLNNQTTAKMNEHFFLSTRQYGMPTEYNFNGITAAGDTKVDLWPVPTSKDNISFNLYLPQDNLKNDGDILLTPAEPIILGAFARALVERGEDGGLNSSEAYALYKASLADAIALESTRYIEEDGWEAV